MAKRKKARADGEGSIFSRPNGMWVAQVQLVGADGKRKIKTKMAATQAEARRKLTVMKSDQDAHRLVVTGRATVRDWLDLWLEEFVKPNRAPQTYTNYFNVLKHHLSDRIARMPLSKIAPEDIQRQLNAVAAGGHARSAVLLRAVLRSSFNKAVKLRRMPGNPVLGTDPVNYNPIETPTFTIDEGLRFLTAAEGDRLGAMFMIMLSLGLREGEAAGLKVDDIDLDGRVLHVRRSLQWSKLPGQGEGSWIDRPPKAKSKRDLPITETIRSGIIRHVARREHDAVSIKNWKDSGYLFVSVTGAPLHPRNMLSAFHRLCDAAQVPRVRIHDTRHTCGTLLHAQGADPFIIQRVLGHSQLTTTRRYTHVPLSVTKSALAALESAFQGAKKEREEPAEKIATENPPTIQ
jgi:integrase